MFHFFYQLFSTFSATLYVGEHEHGLYAMPSLVDQQTLTIAPAANGPLLLEGPQNLSPNSENPSEISLSEIKDSKPLHNNGGSSDPYNIPMGNKFEIFFHKFFILYQSHTN